MTSPVRLQHPELRCLNVQNLVSTFPSVCIIARLALLESGLYGHGDWRHIKSFAQQLHVVAARLLCVLEA